MSVSGRIEQGASQVDTIFRGLAIFTIVISLAGFFLALWTGGLVVALHELFGSIGLASRSESAAPYPLGGWTLLIYVCGAVLGYLAQRHPLPIGLAMLPLGVIALLFGGPITRVYGTIVLLIGIALIATVLYRRTHVGNVGR
ncbi:MAG: hypothetical protein ACREUX_21475 [Burkholderiales bacterium]